MVRLMVGRDISQYYDRKPHAKGDVILEVSQLVTRTWPKHALNFAVRSGEVVGIAGLVGAGRTEMIRTLFGIDQPLSGQIKIAGKPVKIASPRDAIEAGIALVPEDRKQHGLVVDMPVWSNVGLAGLWANRLPGGFARKSKELSDTREMIQKLRIKTPHERQIARFLSGGNQQKVVLGKWLALGPKILLLDEPTRGIDVGAKQEIYRLMEELAKQGMAILFVSSELEEIIGMSDRTLVMHEGRLTANFLAKNYPRKRLCD